MGQGQGRGWGRLRQRLAEDFELSVFYSPALLLLLPGALCEAGVAHSTVFMTLSDPQSSPWLPVTTGKAKLY